MEVIKERIEYLKKQLAYYKSIGDKDAVNVFSAIINELNYWVYIYECIEMRLTDERALLN